MPFLDPACHLPASPGKVMLKGLHIDPPAFEANALGLQQKALLHGGLAT
jgi:hypothetical protein